MSTAADRLLLRLVDAVYRVQKQLQYPRAGEMTLPLLRPVRERIHESIVRVAAPILMGKGTSGPLNALTAGWFIDPEADYGETTPAQFRMAAPASGRPEDLTGVPPAN